MHALLVGLYTYDGVTLLCTKTAFEWGTGNVERKWLEEEDKRKDFQKDVFLVLNNKRVIQSWKMAVFCSSDADWVDVYETYLSPPTQRPNKKTNYSTTECHHVMWKGFFLLTCAKLNSNPTCAPSIFQSMSLQTNTNPPDDKGFTESGKGWKIAQPSWC